MDNQLLSQIQSGLKLKPTKTNDRSGPFISKKVDEETKIVVQRDSSKGFQSAVPIPLAGLESKVIVEVPPIQKGDMLTPSSSSSQSTLPPASVVAKSPASSPLMRPKVIPPPPPPPPQTAVASPVPSTVHTAVNYNPTNDIVSESIVPKPVPAQVSAPSSAVFKLSPASGEETAFHKFILESKPISTNQKLPLQNNDRREFKQDNRQIPVIPVHPELELPLNKSKTTTEKEKISTMKSMPRSPLMKKAGSIERSQQEKSLGNFAQALLPKDEPSFRKVSPETAVKETGANLNGSPQAKAKEDNKGDKALHVEPPRKMSPASVISVEKPAIAAKSASPSGSPQAKLKVGNKDKPFNEQLVEPQRKLSPVGAVSEKVAVKSASPRGSPLVKPKIIANKEKPLIEEQVKNEIEQQLQKKITGNNNNNDSVNAAKPDSSLNFALKPDSIDSSTVAPECLASAPLDELKNFKFQINVDNPNDSIIQLQRRTKTEKL